MSSHYSVHTIDLEFLGNSNNTSAYLVESNDGVILVETGPHSTFPTLKRKIEEIGFKVEDIKHVLLTHIHLDHAGAAWCFADLGATIYLHPKGYNHMHDPTRLLASAKMIYKEMMDQLWGTLNPIAAEQLVQIEHNQELSINGLDIKALHTPGHAKHHIAWRINDVIFVGDVAGVCINNGPIVPPCPPPDINVEDWNNSIVILSEEKDVLGYYLTHFGYIEDVEAHLVQLKNAIDQYASFIEPHAISGKTMKEILPDFRNFVNTYLTDNGLDAADAMAYEAANPPDMSATGLLRYWTKKIEASS